MAPRVRLRISGAALLLAIALWLVGCGGDGGGGDVTATRLFTLTASAAQAGRILVGTETEVLTVHLTDSKGQPRSGLSIVFMAPRYGASGTFADAAPEGPHVRRVTTDANGQASATFTSNGVPGVYALSAHLVDAEDIGSVIPLATFARTNRSAIAPALSAEAARTAMESRLLAGRPNSILHGPVLLEPGTVIGIQDGMQTPSEPSITVAQQSWFFWADDEPQALFAHPTRFALLNAADAASGFESRAQVTDQLWWPILTLPGGEQASLLPASYIEGNDVDGASIPGTRLAPGPTRAPEDACAIIVYGPNQMGSGKKTAEKQREFLIRTDKVKVDHIWPPNDDNPASCEELKQYIAEAKAHGCKKIYLFITAHGWNEPGSGFGGWCELADKSQPTNWIKNDPICRFYYSDLAYELERVGAEINAVITACRSGSAIPAFQNRGITGWITTSSDAESKSRWHLVARYNFYARNLLNCWEDPAADTDGDGVVTLKEAHDCVLKNPNKGNPFPGSITTNPQPQSGPIGVSPNAENFGPLPKVEIVETNGSTQITLLRGNIPTGSNFKGKLTIANTGIATFDGSPAALNISFLPGDIDPKKITFYGEMDGQTTYQLTGHTEDDGKRWESPAGNIRVGSQITANFSKVIVRVSGFQQVLTERLGVLRDYKDTVTFEYASSDPTLFTLSQTAQNMAPGVVQGFTSVQAGYKTGTGTLTFTVKQFPSLVLTIPVTVVQELTLGMNLTAPGSSEVLFHAGDKILFNRIRGYRIVPPEAGCPYWHLHAEPGGLYIDDKGPFPDPDSTHCGFGQIVQPPG